MGSLRQLKLMRNFRILTVVFRYLMGDCSKNRDSLEVHRDWIRGKKHKLKEGKF